MKKNCILLLLFTLVFAACNQKSSDVEKVTQEKKPEKKKAVLKNARRLRKRLRNKKLKLTLKR